MGEELDEAGKILGMKETHGGATACGYGAEQSSVRDVRERLLARDRCIAAHPCIGGRPWGGGSGSGVTRVLCAAVHDFSFDKGVVRGVLFGAGDRPFNGNRAPFRVLERSPGKARRINQLISEVPHELTRLGGVELP